MREMKRTGKKKRTERKWIYLLLAVCAAALIGEGLLLAGVFSRKKPKKTATDTPTVTPEDIVITPSVTVSEPVVQPKQEVRIWRPVQSSIDEDEESYKLFDIRYDERGNVIERITYLDNREELERVLYFYDGEDRLVKTEEYTRDYEAKRLHEDPTVETRQYDANGNLVRTERKPAFGGESVTRSDYTYDDAHHLLTETHYQAVPMYSSSGFGQATCTEYEYNSAGKRSKEVRQAGWYQAYGDNAWEYTPHEPEKYEWECTYEYDGGGNCVSENGKDLDTGVLSTVIRTFDKEGHILSERREYTADGETHGEISFAYGYDVNGLLIAEYTNTHPDDPADPYTHKSEYTYGEKGRKIRCKSTFIDGTFMEDIEYRYDENGMVSEEIRYTKNGAVNSIRTNRYQEFLLPYEKLTEEERDWWEREQGQ